jgi:hypothetical protein
MERGERKKSVSHLDDRFRALTELLGPTEYQSSLREFYASGDGRSLFGLGHVGGGTLEGHYTGQADGSVTNRERGRGLRHSWNAPKAPRWVY